MRFLGIINHGNWVISLFVFSPFFLPSFSHGACVDFVQRDPTWSQVALSEIKAENSNLAINEREWNQILYDSLVRVTLHRAVDGGSARDPWLRLFQRIFATEMEETDDLLQEIARYCRENEKLARLPVEPERSQVVERFIIDWKRRYPRDASKVIGGFSLEEQALLIGPLRVNFVPYDGEKWSAHERSYPHLQVLSQILARDPQYEKLSQAELTQYRKKKASEFYDTLYGVQEKLVERLKQVYAPFYRESLFSEGDPLNPTRYLDSLRNEDFAQSQWKLTSLIPTLDGVYGQTLIRDPQGFRIDQESAYCGLSIGDRASELTLTQWENNFGKQKDRTTLINAGILTREPGIYEVIVPAYQGTSGSLLPMGKTYLHSKEDHAALDLSRKNQNVSLIHGVAFFKLNCRMSIDRQKLHCYAIADQVVDRGRLFDYLFQDEGSMVLIFYRLR